MNAALLMIEPLAQQGMLLLAVALLAVSRFLYGRRRMHWHPRLYRLLYGLVLPGAAVLLLGLFALHEAHGPSAVCGLLQALIFIVLSVAVVALFVERDAPSPPFAQTVLLVGAHPDDIELGASGFVMRLRAEGARVFGVVMSRGEKGSGGRAEDRSAECQEAARLLGLEACWVLDYPDTRLRDHVHAMKAAIEKKVEELGIEVIVTHSPRETHGDHAAVFEAAKEGGRHCSILSFETVSTPQDFVPNFFVNIAPYVSDKVRAIRAHRSQRQKSYMDPAMVRGRAAHRGLQAGVPYAEAFSVYRWVR